jgi:hypothetical protein
MGSEHTACTALGGRADLTHNYTGAGWGAVR